MQYFVFQGSNLSRYGKERSALENFNFLVKEKSIWGFGLHTAYRKVIKPGDKALFYLTGALNQVFVGYATIQSEPYEDAESKEWFVDPETLRIDLSDVVAFEHAKPRKEITSIEWKPVQGGAARISERDFQVITGLLPDKLTNIESEGTNEFFLEKYLEEFIISNWDRIDFGEKLTLYEDSEGNKGQQFYTQDVGYIDILALDSKNNFVVIELKKGRKNDEVVGQVLRYIGWVRRNLAKKNQDVRGLIIVGDRDPKLEYAMDEVKGKVGIKLYKIDFKLSAY